MNERNRPQITMRGYQIGDEDDLVALLNLAYSRQVTSLQGWRWMHTYFPTFTADSEFNIEVDGKIVGCGTGLLRDLSVFDGRLTIAVMGGNAVHPDFRGHGIYAMTTRATLQWAGSKGAAMAFCWKPSEMFIYRHLKKMGFVDIKPSAYTYCRVINPRKVLEVGFRDFVATNDRAKALLDDFKHELHVGIENQELSIAQLFGEDSPNSAKYGKIVRILLTESALPLLLRLASASKFGKVSALLQLILLRKVKVRSNSPVTFLRFAWKGVRLFV